MKRCCHEVEHQFLLELGLILHTSPSIESAYEKVVLWTHEKTKAHDDRIDAEEYGDAITTPRTNKSKSNTSGTVRAG